MKDCCYLSILGFKLYLLCSVINRDGLETARTAVKSIFTRYEGLEMPSLLAGADRPFRFELVKLRIVDGLAEITLNRPDAMNALNEE